MGYPVALIFAPAAAIAALGFLLPSQAARSTWIGVAVASSIVFWFMTRDFNEGSPFDGGMFIGFLTVVVTVLRSANVTGPPSEP